MESIKHEHIAVTSEMARRLHGRWHFTNIILERLGLALEALISQRLRTIASPTQRLSQEIPLPAAVISCHLKILEWAREMAQHVKVLGVLSTQA